MEQHDLELHYKRGVRIFKIDGLKLVLTQKINGEYYFLTDNLSEYELTPTSKIDEQREIKDFTVKDKVLCIIANSQLCIDYYKILPEIFFNKLDIKSLEETVNKFLENDSNSKQKVLPNLDYLIASINKDKVTKKGKHTKKEIDLRFSSIMSYNKLITTVDDYIMMFKKDLSLSKSYNDNEIAYVIYRYVLFTKNYQKKLEDLKASYIHYYNKQNIFHKLFTK